MTAGVTWTAPNESPSPPRRPSSPSAQSAAPNASTPGDAALSIVPQKPVDQNGSEVKLESSGAAVDPAGDGKATCPPVALAMAGPLTGRTPRSAPMSRTAPSWPSISNTTPPARAAKSSSGPSIPRVIRRSHRRRAGDRQRRVDRRLVGPTWSGRPRRRVRSSTRPAWWRSPVGHQCQSLRAGLEDVLPRVVERRRAGPVTGQLHEEHPRREEGVRGRRQHRRRQGPGGGDRRHPGSDHRLGVHHLDQKGDRTSRPR